MVLRWERQRIVAVVAASQEFLVLVVSMMECGLLWFLSPRSNLLRTPCFAFSYITTPYVRNLKGERISR